MTEEAALDSGPLIHLDQIDRLEILDCLENLYTTEEVAGEVGQQLTKSAGVEVEALEGEGKDFSKAASERYSIELGEATAIALARKKGIKLVLTDDLDAREAAESVGIEPHGTLGLVTRAFREEIIGEEGAIETVEGLYHDSALFITKELVDWAIQKIKQA